MFTPIYSANILFTSCYPYFGVVTRGLSILMTWTNPSREALHGPSPRTTNRDGLWAAVPENGLSRGWIKSDVSEDICPRLIDYPYERVRWQEEFSPQDHPAGPHFQCCQVYKGYLFGTMQDCREKGKAWNVSLRRLTRKVVSWYSADVSTDWHPDSVVPPSMMMYIILSQLIAPIYCKSG